MTPNKHSNDNNIPIRYIPQQKPIFKLRLRITLFPPQKISKKIIRTILYNPKDQLTLMNYNLTNPSILLNFEPYTQERNTAPSTMNNQFYTQLYDVTVIEDYFKIITENSDKNLYTFYVNFKMKYAREEKLGVQSWSETPILINDLIFLPINVHNHWILVTVGTKNQINRAL